MAYTRTDWKDGTTPIDAANMNKIEDGIAANADDISSLNDDLAYSADSKNYTSTSDMLADWETLSARQPRLIGVSSEAVQFLTNSTTSSAYYGMVALNGSNYDYFLYSAGTSVVYEGRVSGGAVTTLRSITFTSVSLSSVGDPVVMEEAD